MDELPQPTTQQTKQLFYNLCLAYGFDDDTLQKLADMSKINKTIVDAMFVSIAVRRVEDGKVLMAFSEYTGKTWGFNNVKVALMQTFADLHAEHQFDLPRLATSAGVPFAILNKMIMGYAVSSQEARLVLQMVSHYIRMPLTLENVDVLINEEVQYE